MSDTLANLLSSQRSSTVLQGIANPPQVNPLAAMNSALSTAGNVYNLRGLQAQEAWGDALQQATDDQGNVNFPRATAIAAGMGPRTQMGMMGNLGNASNLRSAQQQQIANQSKLFATAAVSVAHDPSDANLEASFDSLLAAGMPREQVERERARWRAMPEVERRRQAVRVGASAIEQLQLFTGTTQPENVGGEIKGVYRQQPLPGFSGTQGAVGTGTGSVPVGLSWGEALQFGITYKASQADVDAGRATTVGEDVRVPGPDVIKRFGYQGALPPGARANTPAGGAGGGGGGPVNRDGTPVTKVPPRMLRTPTTPPAATSVPPPVPAPRPGVPTSANEPPNPLAGGVQVADANALSAPAVGAPAPASPLVPGYVDAIQQGMDQARATPRPGTQVAASFSTGAGLDEQNASALSADALKRDGVIAGTHAKTIFPMAQALHLYGRGMTTAPGTDMLNQAKGFFGGALRSWGLPNPFGDETASYDALKKFITQTATTNPMAAHSDAALASVLAGNASTHVHEMAGEDMMKVGIAMHRMTSAAYSEWQKMTPQQRAQHGGYYHNYLTTLNKSIDPRAFAFDLYNPHQLQTLRDDLAKGDRAYNQRFWDSVDMVKRNGYLGENRAMP